MVSSAILRKGEPDVKRNFKDLSPCAVSTAAASCDALPRTSRSKRSVCKREIDRVTASERSSGACGISMSTAKSGVSLIAEDPVQRDLGMGHIEVTPLAMKPIAHRTHRKCVTNMRADQIGGGCRICSGMQLLLIYSARLYGRSPRVCRRQRPYLR